MNPIALERINEMAGVSAPSLARRIARYLPAVGRILLGLVFTVFGLDGFLHFIPQPTGPLPEGAMAFGMAMMKTGYLFQLLKGTEVLGGILLLSNRFVPLALTILAPVIVNIVAFHVFLEPEGLPLALVILAIEIGLAWRYRAAFRPMLVGRTRS
jgi:uncharacterized membrane protein YphA (DoxX/SURF4 family)